MVFSISITMKRREFLEVSGYLGFTAGIFFSHPVLLEIPRSDLTKIFVADVDFLSKIALKDKLVYSPRQQKSTLLLGLGDSQAWGSPHKEKGDAPPLSILTYWYDLIKKSGLDWPEPINKGQPGWNTQLLRNRLLLTPGYQDEIKDFDSITCLLSIGGNNFMPLLDNIPKAEAVQRFLSNPTDLAAAASTKDIVFKYLPGIINSFEDEMLETINSVIKSGQGRVQNLAVLTIPNLSKLSNADSGRFEGSDQGVRIPVRNSALAPILRIILSQLSIYLNNQIAGAVEKSGVRNIKKPNIILLDAFKLPFNPFEEDEHLNKEAMKELAKEAFSKMYITAA